MNTLPHLQTIFEQLSSGRHLSSEDEPAFSALRADPEAYIAYFAPLGLKLKHHPREFFYFEPESSDATRDTMPRIAVFSFILIDHAANQGRSVEEHLMTQHFFISGLPHFTLDRYAAMLRQVGVEDNADIKRILNNMERLGWVKAIGDDEFRFLRPFHRVFDKCVELTTEPDDAGDTVFVDNLED